MASGFPGGTLNGVAYGLLAALQLEHHMRPFLLWTLALFGGAASACGACRPVVLARIRETLDGWTVLALLAPVMALAALALAVHLSRRP